VGKDAILTRMHQLGISGEYITTATTRPKRPQETDNIDYCFLSEEKFKYMIENGQLLEHAEVYGNYYGVPFKSVTEPLDKGRDVFIKVDVQGAETIKNKLPQAVFIFVLPPSYEELTARLKKRLTESKETLERRLAATALEMEKLPMFDYTVVNYQDEIDQAVAEIRAIITAEKCRLPRRSVKYKSP
jgi:guanylate kinase